MTASRAAGQPRLIRPGHDGQDGSRSDRSSRSGIAPPPGAGKVPPAARGRRARPAPPGQAPGSSAGPAGQAPSPGWRARPAPPRPARHAASRRPACRQSRYQRCQASRPRAASQARASRDAAGMRIGRSRSTMIQARVAGCAAAVVIIAGVTGVGQSDPSVAVSVKAFLLAWENRDYAAAAALTTGQQSVVARSCGTPTASSAPRICPSAWARSACTATPPSPTSMRQSTWAGAGGHGRTEGHFTLLRHGSGWLVAWSPSVVVPGLGRW